MSEKNDPLRNRPSGEGRDNDPNIRDESATQPGTSTISQSGTDDLNNRVTGSAMDGGEITSFDKDQSADTAFDEVDLGDKI